MSDPVSLKALQEALDRHKSGTHSPPEIHKVIIPAARCLLKGERMSWCVNHDSSWSGEIGRCRYAAGAGLRRECDAIEEVIIVRVEE